MDRRVEDVVAFLEQMLRPVPVMDVEVHDRHTLDAVDAHGVTGPNLDDLAPLDKQRVLNAIKRGGTGDGRMPANILQGQNAQDLATWVSQVAGQ